MDWDKFIQDGTELERSLTEVSSRLEQQNAHSRRKRTRAAVLAVQRLRAEREHERASGETAQFTGRAVLARESPSDDSVMPIGDRLRAFEADTRLVLAEIRQDLLMLRRDVDRIRELIATRAEVESLRDDIKVVAGGFAQTQQRLHDVAGLSRRYIVDRSLQAAYDYPEMVTVRGTLATRRRS